MKKLFLTVSILMLLISACKTPKQSLYQPPVQNLEEEVKAEVVIDEPEKPIFVKTEEVTIEKSDDQKLYPYYVIIGSFSIKENAYNLQNQLMEEGVPAVVLKTETGMMRLAYLGTKSEQKARTSIAQIRKENKYPDVWLLKTK